MKLEGIAIEVHQLRTDIVNVGRFPRASSPATVTLDPATTGAGILKVGTVTRFTTSTGRVITATCNVRLPQAPM